LHADPSPLYRLISSLSRPILRLIFRYRAVGVENLPPEGGFVLAAGHHSNFDPWPLALAISPRHFVRFMAKAELFWPPLSWIIEGSGGFKVHRGEPDREAIATARRLAREGNVVGMFPEGTRREKGPFKRRQAAAHTGAARIALAAGVPLVPAALIGTDRLSRLGPVTVVYGKPIPLADLAGIGRKQAAELATERLMTAIGELEAAA
jgi:1-acyl-sn-glycerol-3-phosphate acyltransferase